MRRLWNGFLWLLFAAGTFYLVGLWCGMQIAWPSDVVLNVGGVIAAPELAAPADGKRRVVVLVHGMFRSSASLARLQRCCEQHGYEAIGYDYPSTAARIERHADGLAAAIAARAAQGPVDEWYFVAHSMGGLVVQEYLRREGAVEPTRLLCLGVPHRGAQLAELRRRWFLFALAAGSAGAAQLCPDDPLHDRPIRWLERSACLIGRKEPGSASVAGPDDGTVAMHEAALPEPATCKVVPHGHTMMTLVPGTQREMLSWFRAGKLCE